MPEGVLPDPREAARLFLNERKPRAPLPFVAGISLEGAGNAFRLTQAGGPEGYGWGEPLILVESWGKSGQPDDGSAARLARWAAAEFESMRGPYAGGYIAGASVEGGIADAPDPATKRARANMTVRLQTAPLQEEQA